MSETPAAQVLIVEDEPDHADVMADALRKLGHVSTVVNSLDDAVEELEGGAFDVIVTDLRMPESGGRHGAAADGGDAGFIVLRTARDLQPAAETIIVTAHGDVSVARSAFKDGAFDFVEKPIDLELFRAVVDRAAETVLLRHHSEGMDDLVQHDGFEGIIAGSEAMRRILDTVRTVAAAKIPVLVTGESGTGKELIARAVHDHSPRTKKRYVAFNCAGQSESLLEDELFGHVRGAFTGADKDREGVFEYADGGTLFLDEINSASPAMQLKLLRVLQERKFEPVGSNETIEVDVRVILASNQPLEAPVADGSFRQDLYYRINVVQIEVPPLRDRTADLPALAKHFLDQQSKELGRHFVGFTDEAMQLLKTYPFPGNVRELSNIIERASVLTKGLTITAEDLPPNLHNADTPQPSTTQPTPTEWTPTTLTDALRDPERQIILAALIANDWNRTLTAEVLDINRTTLYKKMKSLNIDPDDHAQAG